MQDTERIYSQIEETDKIKYLLDKDFYFHRLIKYSQTKLEKNLDIKKEYIFLLFRTHSSVW